MDKIPSLIHNIVLVGQVNSGKSSLINALTDQNISIVSSVAGTTSDEVVKRFELLDVGPVNLIDTAGFSDDSVLGQQRMAKTNKVINRASLILNVVDASSLKYQLYKTSKPLLLVFNKIDLLNNEQLTKLQADYPNAIFVSSYNNLNIDILLNKLKQLLNNKEVGLLDNITFKHKKIIHVTPIDSAAPKGRLILPQMQLIRECLDLHLASIVLQVEELEDYLAQDINVDLIVTDSQAFKEVSAINNKRISLTSYSILQANQKADLAFMVNNLAYLNNLQEDAKILLMESCSHNVSHDDIGRVKIPKMLNNMLDINFTYDFMMGYDFPEDLSKYDFIIHCGSCMLHADVMQNRLQKAKDAGVPISNYGLFMAYHNKILDEAVAIFNIENKI